MEDGIELCSRAYAEKQECAVHCDEINAKRADLP
jgi:hypothetical protein